VHLQLWCLGFPGGGLATLIEDTRDSWALGCWKLRASLSVVGMLAADALVEGVPPSPATGFRSLLAQRAPGYQLRRLPRQKSQPAATAWQGKVLGYATGGSPPPRLLKATMAHSRSACCIAASWWKILLIVELKFIGCYSRKSTSKNDQLWQFRCVRKIKGWDPMNREDGLALAHTCRYGLQSKTGMCNSDPQDCFM
jgi:hypothetical protein